MLTPDNVRLTPEAFPALQQAKHDYQELVIAVARQV